MQMMKSDSEKRKENDAETNLALEQRKNYAFKNDKGMNMLMTRSKFVLSYMIYYLLLGI